MWGHVEEEKHATLEAAEKRRQKLYKKLKTLSIWLDRPGPFLCCSFSTRFAAQSYIGPQETAYKGLLHCVS